MDFIDLSPNEQFKKLKTFNEKIKEQNNILNKNNIQLSRYSTKYVLFWRFEDDTISSEVSFFLTFIMLYVFYGLFYFALVSILLSLFSSFAGISDYYVFITFILSTLHLMRVTMKVYKERLKREKFYKRFLAKKARVHLEKKKIEEINEEYKKNIFFFNILEFSKEQPDSFFYKMNEEDEKIFKDYKKLEEDSSFKIYKKYKKITNVEDKIKVLNI